MKISSSQKLQLAKIPFGLLNVILLQKGVPVRDSKQSALDTVCVLIENDNIEFAEALAILKNHPVSKFAPKSQTPMVENSFEAQITAIHEEIILVKDNASSEAFRLANKMREDLTNAVCNLNQLVIDSKVHSINLIESEVKQLKREIEQAKFKIENVDIELTLQSEVAKVFSAFKQSTPIEQLEVIAQSIPIFTLKKAKDVFEGTLKYKIEGDTVDFSQQMVAVWNDPNAPQRVDDYNFNPAHLHQTLCALEGSLPDNVWLGGERGTGKTEFVTQIASRLGRRLFKVSFDEAMERSEFIGGNTIKNGSVEWQDGIISQAIKHCGSIILLDEIGFARSQNLASLHAVLERSPHRALVIPETGSKIPVASHVVFFCADNSNGFGDPSGNFTGVREQNSAFIDRFSFTLMFEYLPFADEVTLVHNRTGLPKDATEVLVAFANVAREKAKLGVLTQPPSLRQLFAWARAIQRGVPVATAFTNAVVNKFPLDCEGDLRGIYSATVNESNLKSFLTN